MGFSVRLRLFESFVLYSGVLIFSTVFNGLTVNLLSILEGDTKASSCRNHAAPHLLKIERLH